MWNLWWIVIAIAILTIIETIFVISVKIASNRDCTLCELDDFANWSCLIYIISSIGIIMGVLMLSAQLEARRDYQEFVYTQQMVNEIYIGDEYTQLENAGLNNKIIEINQWLTQAKASKKQFGNWSVYCTVDIDSLEYIKLKN